MINSNRDFTSVKLEHRLIGELENLFFIWSRAFTPVMSYEPASRPETRYQGKGSTPIKILRHLLRLDSTHLTGFRYLT